MAREQAGEIAFRSGAITPEGLIEDDFEKELGTPSVIINLVLIPLYDIC